MKRHFFSIIGLASSAVILLGDVSPTLNYQGRVTVGGTNYTGVASFKFALLQETAFQTFWSNDGSSVGGSQPAGSVSFAVNNGLMVAVLGKGMNPIPYSVGTNADIRLRVWLNVGSGFEQLSPDQSIASVPTAFVAQEALSLKGSAISWASVLDGAIPGAKIQAGSIMADRLAPGAISSLAAPDGDPANAVVVDNNGSVQMGHANGPTASLKLQHLSPGGGFVSLFGNIADRRRAGISVNAAAGIDDAGSRQQFTLYVAGRDAVDGTPDGLSISQYPPNANPACCIQHLRLWLDNGNVRHDFSGMLGTKSLVIGDSFGVGAAIPGIRMAVDGRIRLQGGASADTAGAWLFDNSTGQNKAFMGLGPNTERVGLWGSGAGWGLTMDVASGNVGIGTTEPQAKLHVSGDIHVGGSGPSGQAIISAPNRLLIQAGEYLYLNPTGNSQVIVGGGGGSGNLWVLGETRTGVLEITGGGDVAEPFSVSDTAKPEPGTVLAIDRAHPGELRMASRAYDRTVAGIVSGANGINPGLTLRQKDTVVDGTHPVALSGRVYCRCDASYGEIHPGDLLTTSDTPGHAMAVQDFTRAHGATLGKAMTGLKEGKGLVLVLVSLQ